MPGGVAAVREADGMAEPLTRESVVAATRDLIRSDGLEAVSLRRVGAALGVTAPALYAYVQDKRDLLRAVADEEFTALVARFQAVQADDPVERTRGYCRAYIEHALASPELFKVMFLFPPGVGMDPAEETALASATEAFTLPVDALVETIEAGRLRETDPLLATFTTWTAMHGTAEVLLMGFDFDDAFRERLIESTVELVVRGMATDPAHP